MRWELWPIPRSSLPVIAKEILLSPSLFKHKRYLWPFSLSLHFGIYMLIICLLLIFFDVLGSRLGSSVMHWAGRPVPPLASIGHFLGLLGSSVLLFLRLIHRDLRPFSSNSRYFTLLLLMGVFGTGLCTASTAGLLDVYRSYVEYLLGIRAGLHLDTCGYAHIVAALIFLIWLPFSDTIHFITKYFMYHWVRWDKRLPDRRMERSLLLQKARVIRWASVEGGGEQTSWGDL